MRPRVRLSPKWAVLAAMLVLIGACAPARRFALAPGGTPPGVPSPLRAGIADNYPPLAFVEEGFLAGMEVDFATELQTSLGVPVEIVATPWDDLIPDLLGGRIDVVMSGMSITPERALRVRFTDPYLDVGQMALIRGDQRATLAAPGALYREGWRVAVIADTTSAEFAASRLPSAIVVPYTSVDDAVEAVRREEADYFIHDAPTIWRITADPEHIDGDLLGLFEPLTEERIAWSVRPDDAALADALNATLARWRESGRLGEIQSRWIRTAIEVN